MPRITNSVYLIHPRLLERSELNKKYQSPVILDDICCKHPWNMQDKKDAENRCAWGGERRNVNIAVVPLQPHHRCGGRKPVETRCWGYRAGLLSPVPSSSDTCFYSFYPSTDGYRTCFPSSTIKPDFVYSRQTLSKQQHQATK